MSLEAMGSGLGTAGLAAVRVLEDAHQEHSQDDGDDEQSQRDRGTAPKLEVLERDVEQVDRQDVGGVGRSAAGQDQDRVDEPEIVHESQQNCDQEERIEVGQGDRQEVADL